MRQKIKFSIFCMSFCWIIVFVQFAMTRFYLAHNDAAQAFARNQLVVENGHGDLQNLSEKGGIVKGHLSGRISAEQKEHLASHLFHSWGGAVKSTHQTSGYYVAYGYTSGITFYKKINGQKINLNLAIAYDEISDETTVYLGIPLLNSDF